MLENFKKLINKNNAAIVLPKYNSYNAVWGEAIINEQIKLSNLNALWGEISIGAKTKVLKNLFLGIEVQLKTTFTQKNKDGITNLYLPGFNRTYDSSGVGGLVVDCWGDGGSVVVGSVDCSCVNDSSGDGGLEVDGWSDGW